MPSQCAVNECGGRRFPGYWLNRRLTSRAFSAKECSALGVPQKSVGLLCDEHNSMQTCATCGAVCLPWKHSLRSTGRIFNTIDGVVLCTECDPNPAPSQPTPTQPTLTPLILSNSTKYGILAVKANDVKSLHVKFRQRTNGYETTQRLGMSLFQYSGSAREDMCVFCVLPGANPACDPAEIFIGPSSINLSIKPEPLRIFVQWYMRKYMPVSIDTNTSTLVVGKARFANHIYSKACIFVCIFQL